MEDEDPRPESDNESPDEDDESPKGWAAKSSLSKVLIFFLFISFALVLKVCVLGAINSID